MVEYLNYPIDYIAASLCFALLALSPHVEN
jgi:hypothetical protein